MVKRIVIMELLPGKEGLFLDIFDQVKKQIRAQEGCRGLEILEKRGRWAHKSLDHKPLEK